MMKSMPATSKPDDHRRLPGDLGIVGVDVVGAVDGGAAGAHVAGLLELNVLPGRGNGVELEPLTGQRLQCQLVDRDAREHLFVADAATRIGIRELHQLTDRLLAVADDVSRHPLGDGHDAFVDDEDAIVPAGDEPLDQHQAIPAFAGGGREAVPHGVFRGKVQADTPAVIAVERFEHDRVADPPGGGDRLVDGTGHLPSWRRHADVLEEPVRQVFVAGDGVGNVGGGRGDRRPDPLLVTTVTELND